jgi:F-type H+-transporting ATPase subunit gamma
MQMVSTSKMRKTQERMRAARPYAEKVRTVMAHLAQANADLGHPLLARRDVVKRAGIILVSSDKGLCGGLNVNSFKRFYAKVKELQEQNVEIDVPPRPEGRCRLPVLASMSWQAQSSSAMCRRWTN